MPLFGRNVFREVPLLVPLLVTSAAASRSARGDDVVTANAAVWEVPLP